MISFFVIMSWAEAGKNKKQGSILKSEGKSQIKIKKFESVFYTTGLSAQDRKKIVEKKFRKLNLIYAKMTKSLTDNKNLWQDISRHLLIE